mmetsp:Transcript_7573/g.22357  ORF Transcript_7573/g.22357 Transcript_7573/m.22357 type:complete len:433 (-) Transcript_7573:2959-4257(-)
MRPTEVSISGTIAVTLRPDSSHLVVRAAGPELHTAVRGGQRLDGGGAAPLGRLRGGQALQAGGCVGGAPVGQLLRLRHDLLVVGVERLPHGPVQVPGADAHGGDGDQLQPEQRGPKQLLGNPVGGGVLAVERLLQRRQREQVRVDQAVGHEGTQGELPGPEPGQHAQLRGHNADERHEHDLAHAVQVVGAVPIRRHGGIVDDEEHRGGVGDAHQHTRLPERSDRQRVVHVVHLGETDVGVQVSERSVQHRKKADGERRKESVVEGGGDAIKKRLTGPASEDLEVEQQERQCYVFVEGVADQASQTIHGQRAVDHQQSDQEPELPNGVVTIVDSLTPLLAHDANPDVRSLNHRDIVCAIADGQHLEGHTAAVTAQPPPPGGPRPHLRHPVLVLRHHAHHRRLLAGRGATHNDRCAPRRHCRQLLLCRGAQDKP